MTARKERIVRRKATTIKKNRIAYGMISCIVILKYFDGMPYKFWQLIENIKEFINILVNHYNCPAKPRRKKKTMHNVILY